MVRHLTVVQRWFGSIIIIPFLVLLTSCAEQNHHEVFVDTSKQDETNIRKLTFEWIDAANQKNSVWFDSVLADEYQMIHSKGTVHNKEEEIQEVKNDTSRTDVDRLQNVYIHVYGDAAIVTSTEHLKGVAGNVPFNLQYFYTDVYIRRNGKWRVVLTQATRLPDSEDKGI